MRDGLFTSLKRWVWWDFPRGSLQYDVMVALILAFVFITPRTVFRDHPRPKEVVMLQGEDGGAVFWVDPGLLAAVPESARLARVRELVVSQGGNEEFDVKRVEPIFDSEEEIRGFMAFAEPSE